jgi:hypothetical protein
MAKKPFWLRGLVDASDQFIQRAPHILTALCGASTAQSAPENAGRVFRGLGQDDIIRFEDRYGRSLIEVAAAMPSG